MFKKDYGAYICENGKYLKDIADTSVVVCDKIINAINSIKKCDKYYTIKIWQMLYQQMTQVVCQYVLMIRSTI